LILLHLIEDKRLLGAVAKTISGTTLLEKICQRHGLDLYETPVGFKHISKLMLSRTILIGGEESGGIGFCGYIPERDGILSALLLTEMLAYRKKPLTAVMDEMERIYGRFFYERLDIDYSFDKAKRLTSRLLSAPPAKIAAKKVIKMKTYDGIKFIMDDESWLLLRFSGTEPLIRLYAEAHSKKDVGALLAEAKRMIKI
jgi:phosphomannomutase